MTLRFLLWCLFFIASLISIQLRFRSFPHILLIFLVSLPLVSLIQSLLIRRRLQVNMLREKEHVLRGEEGQWTYQVSNPPLSSVILQIDKGYERTLYPLKGKGELLLEIKKKGTHTGPLDPPTIKAHLQDSLHFFNLKLPNPALMEKVYVYPLLKKESLRDNQEALHQEDGSMGSKALSNHLDEIYQFREIRPGESLKQAHWKLSAKAQKWILKEYKKDEEPSTLFITRLTKDLKVRDNLLDTTLTSLKAPLSKGSILYLRTFTEKVIDHRGSSLEELPAFQSQLAHIPFDKQLSIKELLDRHEKKDHQSLVLITETLTPEEVNFLKRIRGLFTHVDIIFLEHHREVTTYHENLESTLKGMQVQVTRLLEEGEGYDTKTSQ